MPAEVGHVDRHGLAGGNARRTDTKGNANVICRWRNASGRHGMRFGGGGAHAALTVGVE